MKKLFLTLASVLAVVGLSSCSSEEPAAAQQFEDVQVNKEVKVLSYESFTNADDVTLSADAVTVSVSNDYLASKGMEINEGDVLDVWQSINTMPVIRKVQSIKKEGNRTIVTTEAGGIADVINDGEFILSCKPYVNESATGEARYMSDAHTYHPVVVIRHDVEGSIVGEAETAVQIASRGEYTYNGRLYEETYTVNKTFADPNNIVSVGIKDGYVKPYVDVDFYLKIETLSIQKFQALFTGGIEASLPVVARADASYNWEIHKDLFTSPTFTFVFNIASVPVEVSVTGKLLLEAEAAAKAQFGATMPFKYKGQFTCGPKYDRDNKDNGYKGWEFYHSFTHKKEGGIEALTISGEAAITASAGIYAQVDAMVYGCAGPSLKVGPKFSTTNTITGLGVPNRFNLNSKGEFQVGGTIGAHLTLPVIGSLLPNGGKIADWDEDFVLFHANLWEINRSVVLNQVVINY